MKKIINFAVAALALASMALTSCASTSGSSKKPASVHPRSYVVDLAESKTGTTINVPKNPYDATNYQSDPAMDFTSKVKADKPQAGDVVTVYYKFSSDIDIPQIKFSLIDPTVNYWLELAPDEAIYIDDIKAGEIYEGEQDVVLAQKVSGAFKVYITYDNDTQLAAGLPTVGKSAVITLYDVEGVETTDCDAENNVVKPTGPRTINIEVNKIAALCEIVKGHPWINGVEDKSKIENYQADISYSQLLDDEELKPGDIIVITWKGRPDRDISALKIQPIDHSAEVGWWKEMIDDRSDENVTIGTDLKAGEVFELTKTFVIDTGSVTPDCTLRVWCEVEANNGPTTIIGINN